jgi:oligopeptidase B
MNNQPIAKSISYSSIHHNEELSDNYDWLRDKNWPQVDSPEILDYLTAENDFFKEKMQDSKELEKHIYEELKGRIKEDDESYPVKIDDYYYFSRLVKGKDYPIFYRKQTTEELILDVNILAEGKTSFALGDMSISKDHSKLAYAYDSDGSERYNIYIRDLDRGADLKDIVTDTIGDIVWNKSGSGFFYLKLNKNWRPDQVFFHVLGEDVKNDTLIYKESDQGFHVGIDRSSSDKYLLINTGNSTSNEVLYLDLEKINNPEIAIERRYDHLYEVDHMHDSFYVLTNDMGKNFRLVKTLEQDNFSADKYQEIIAHNSEHYLFDVALYLERLVVSKRILGLNRIEYYDLDTHKLAGKIEFKEEVYESHIQFTNKDDNYLRVDYSSLTTPRSVMEYDFTDKKLHTRKINEIPSGYDSSLYISKRLWVESSDGVQVPVSMVYREDSFKENAPVLMYGYGSYGYSTPVSFRQNIISLLDRGFIYVIPHIRGGDELGFDWYEDAKFLNKKRTFEDFISVAEYLIDHKYTSKEKLSIMGGSAGGLLMGAVINQRPELFNSVVALVPFVDVLKTMLDDSLPLTPGEFEEWGNPIESKEFFDYIKSYCPYSNVKKQSYPHILVTAGLTDPRVGYWEAAKWVAKLRQYRKDDNLLLLKTEMDAGHKGQSGRFKGLEEVAMIYCFLLKTL